jgi:hypothetical protein
LSLASIFDRIALWFASRPTHTKVLLGLATFLVGAELLFRWIAPSSRAYATWTRLFQGIGHVWTGALLAVIYILSIGLVSLAFRLLGKDPLDRELRAEPSFWRSHEANPLGAQRAVRHQF